MKYKLFLFICVFFITLKVFTQTDSSVVNERNIKSAEKLFDLSFTNAERDSAQDNLKSYLKNYDVIHKIDLPNSIPPAILFNPIPVGYVNNFKQEQLIFDDYSNTVMPKNIEDLAFYSIGQLASLIKTKKITSTELTKFYLTRLKKYDPKLKCIITLTEDLALRQAAKADKEIAEGKYRGMLHGIPYGAKDLLAVKNYKTTWGAAPYKNQMINEDASVVKKLEDAGAILVAKLTMGALAWGDVWFGGKTRNPWDTAMGSSGSSAGSASATSAGLVPFAIGTETWGSIVSPSTVCGVSGLRPTYGRVSRNGAMTLSWSMDKIGPICRNAEDLAIVFNAIYGPDGIDQTLYDFPFNYYHEVNLKDLKIGYLKSDFDKQYSFRKNDSLTLKTLKILGANLISIELPDIPVENISFILSAEAAAAFNELTRSNRDDLLVRQIKNAWPNEFRSARFIPAVEYINANRIRFLLIQKMAKLMNEVDLFLAPSDEGESSLLTNLSGHPCVVVPNGFSENRTPTSITLIGRLFEEGKIIAVAKKIQDATDFHLKHPDLDK